MIKSTWHKPIRFLSGLFAALLLVALISAFGCTSQQDACKVFCSQAAECLQCGSTANLERCQDVCNSLSRSEGEALGDCTGDCMTMRVCPMFTQHPDLNPCRP